MDLLLAVKSEVIAEALCPSLSQYNIHICHTGTQALALLNAVRPDAVILDLCLPVIDGLTVLRQAHYKPPVIIALTDLRTDQVIDDTLAAGVQDMLLKPCTTQHIAEHLEQLTALCRKQPKDIVWHLHNLGFNPKLSGYRCLLAAISIYASSPNLMMKEVYPDVASLCGYDDIRRVERVIRTAISDAWAKRRLQTWAQYFPINCHGDIDKPTSKHFISRLSEEM